VNRPRRYLFVMMHAGFVRNYESTLRLLVRRGHRIHIVYENDRNKLGENVVVERLAAELPEVTHGVAARREDGLWSRAAYTARTYMDFLRYLEPRYAKAVRLRDRVEQLVPRRLLQLARAAAPAAAARRGLAAIARLIDRLAPPSPAIAAFVRDLHPDALLVTPLVDVGSGQVDYLREAAIRGIPSALCVASWDNLTNKGLMREIPHRVLLWNDRQKAEAVELHGVPPERVRVTGAQIFDHWFTWRPARTRAEFCAMVGLDHRRPIILYVGSSFFIAPNEADFAERWLTAIRASGDPEVAGANVLIRPHPNNSMQWLGFDFQKFGGVALWPKFEADPFAPEFKHDLFDSLFHCAAVVGVNTSAQIEAAIVGRPVLTVRAPDFVHSQDGTLHFEHLADDDAGLLQIAATLDEHVEQLRQILADPAPVEQRTRAFVHAFVRPHGLETPATPILADELEELAALRVVPARAPWWTAAARQTMRAGLAITQPLWSTADARRRKEPVPPGFALVVPLLHLVANLQVTRMRAQIAVKRWREGERRQPSER